MADVLDDEHLALEVQCLAVFSQDWSFLEAVINKLAIKSSSGRRNSGSELEAGLPFRAIPIFQSKHGFSYLGVDEERKTLRLKYLIHEDFGRLDIKKKISFEKEY